MTAPDLPPGTGSTLVRAAGGLVWRPDPDGPAATDRQAVPDGPGRYRVCLVHRPRQDDWTLPKGKLEPGEHPLAAAVREVREEAGVDAVPRLPLPPVRYRTPDGGWKLVQFWAMAAGADRGAPDSEVDEVAWLPAAEAVRRASYPTDAGLLRRWMALPPVTGVVLLVRHADAGSRDAWSGDDAARPLSAVGVADAARLTGLLALFGPTRLVSATPLRCRQTLSRLARTTGLPVEPVSVFDEAADDPATAAERVRELAAGGGTTVVCSQGAVIPPLLAHLCAGGRPADAGVPHEAGRSGGFATVKGDGWCLPFSGPLLLATTRLASADRRPSGTR